MKPRILFFILFSILGLTPVKNLFAQKVIVNDEPLSRGTIQTLAGYYRIQIREGRYWYDQRSGLWGIEGRPVQGIIRAGLNLGVGPLKSDASAGKSDVFINGREITQYELAELVKMTGSAIQAGRYWLNANGMAGREGESAVVNLFQVAARYYRQNGRSGFFRNSYTGMGGGSSNGTFYIIGKDFSYTN